MTNTMVLGLRHSMIGRRKPIFRLAICDRATPLLRNFVNDRRGSVVVEFALVVTPLIALMLAILQTSFVYFAQQNLETTLEKSVRQLVTGTAQKAGLNQAAFRTSVCSNLPNFLQCDNVMIDVRTVAAFSGASVSKPTLTFDADGKVTNTWNYQPGTEGSITVVTIMYIWATQKGPMSFDLSTMSGNRRLLHATSVFKVEPYS
jgi:Flp pilus assembly protein TadG